MKSIDASKLLHVLVVMGAAMTGATVIGCASGVSPGAAGDAAADKSDADYARIFADSSYGRISAALPPDAGEDAYPNISTDAYPNISPAPLPDAGEDAPSDSGTG